MTWQRNSCGLMSVRTRFTSEIRPRFAHELAGESGAIHDAVVHALNYNADDDRRSIKAMFDTQDTRGSGEELTGSVPGRYAPLLGSECTCSGDHARCPVRIETDCASFALLSLWPWRLAAVTGATPVHRSWRSAPWSPRSAA